MGELFWEGLLHTSRRICFGGKLLLTQILVQLFACHVLLSFLIWKYLTCRAGEEPGGGMSRCVVWHLLRHFRSVLQQDYLGNLWNLGWPLWIVLREFPDLTFSDSDIIKQKVKERITVVGYSMTRTNHNHMSLRENLWIW